MNLRTLQELFLSHMTRSPPGLDPEFAEILCIPHRLLVSDNTEDQKNLSGSKAAGLMEKKSRLDCYRHNVRLAKLNTLQKNFPICQAWVGPSFFEGLAKKYIQETPSQSFSLNDFGASFPTFIAQFQEAQSVPALLDLARLELKMQVLLCKPESSQFDFQALAAVDPKEYPRLCLNLSEDLELLDCDFAVDHIWQWHQEPSNPIDSLTVEKGQYGLLLWRTDEGIKLSRPILEEWQFLKAMDQKKSLQWIIENLKWDGCHLESRITQMIQRGWVTGFHLETGY